jgi:hypothetical protein
MHQNAKVRLLNNFQDKMAKSNSSKKNKTSDNKTDVISREMLAEYISEIAEKTLLEDESKLHSVIAFNQILSDQEKISLLDEEMKDQLKDIWSRIKAAGIQLVDPPLLFGLPEDFSIEKANP